MVVGAGGGQLLASLGRPRNILRCNVRLLVMRLSPIASVGMDQCAIFRIVATVIDYFSLLVTACHRIFTYHCLAPVLAGKNEHRLVLFAERASIIPTNFDVHGSQVKVYPGARTCGFRFRFRHVRTHTHTHTDTTNCKYMISFKSCTFFHRTYKCQTDR